MSGGGVSGGETGRHPNALIRELIADPERIATAEEVASILEHIARAPFNVRMTDVPEELVGMEFLGRELRPSEDSLTAHLARRVLLDKQWREGTTREDFLGDISQAAGHPDAALAIYETRRTSFAGVVAPNTVPRGSDAGEYIVVLYSANRGRMITAYQTADEYVTRIPERARWIRPLKKDS